MNVKGIKNNKPHKIKAKKHITFMMIPDPTKSARVVKIPKWVRFPLYIVIIALTWGAFSLIQHIADLESQVAADQYSMVNSSSTIASKDSTIEELEIANQAHDEKLQKLEELTLNLDQKLKELETYKNTLDSKLNGTEYEVEAQQSESIVVSEAEPVTSFAIGAGKSMFTVEYQEDTFDEDIDELIASVEGSIAVLEKNKSSYEALNNQLDELIPYWNAYPSGYPLDYIQLSSSFGYRKDPIGGYTAFHTGADLYAKYVPVYATGKGIVISVEYESGYGNTVTIDHGYGYVTKYAHLSEFTVSEGDSVERGDQVAVSGASGRVTGAHLHYEIIFNGELQDPMDYIY